MVGTSNTDKTSRKTDKDFNITKIDPWACPFREFKDAELSSELWGLGPHARPSVHSKGPTKGSASDKKSEKAVEVHWRDPQIQPLPVSVRAYLDHWEKAETLAQDLWGADITVYEEIEAGGMPVKAVQLSFSEVLSQSLLTRQILSACFILERLDGFVVEHQWDSFVCNLGPDGWRAKYHIYSPGMKPGGGAQHKPLISKNGCYLVRLYYLGAWRCVWVDDMVPVNEDGEALLPFAPIMDKNRVNRSKLKQIAEITEGPSCTVQLWPLLLCKAMFKLAAPDMNMDIKHAKALGDIPEEFNIMHALTGCVIVTHDNKNYERHTQHYWDLIKAEAQVFSWDDDIETVSSTVKTKSTKQSGKKTQNKDKGSVKNSSEKSYNRHSVIYATMVDTKDVPCYMLPAIAPAHENDILIQVARDLPLKKPLCEPDIPLWKTYRWVDWAKSHGLYRDYECPRTRYLKTTCLMRLSQAPHLHDVPSAESLAHDLRDSKPTKNTKESKKKEPVKKVKTDDVQAQNELASMKKEQREWVLYEFMCRYISKYHVMSYPTQFEIATATSNPVTRIYKGISPKNIDIRQTKGGPIYFQINGPQEIILKIVLSAMHPRVLVNARVSLPHHVEPTYYVLEEFEWFTNPDMPNVKCYSRTRCYDSVELKFCPGRHYFRLWVHSELHWHIMFISKSSMLLGPREVVMANAVEECPWTEKFLNTLGSAFSNWLHVTKSNNVSFKYADRDFYNTYQPDLHWDIDIAGYDKAFIHWMFRKALESMLRKSLPFPEFQMICKIFRQYLKDPDFGMPTKPPVEKSLKQIFTSEPCDCVLPEEEEDGEQLYAPEQFEVIDVPSKSLVTNSMLEELLNIPETKYHTNVCKLAREDLHCATLKNARHKVIMRHVAATLIQSRYRGYRARKYLKNNQIIMPEIIKILMDNVFGNTESLSLLMNEFFIMFPSIKHAYSLSSGLNCGYKLEQLFGSIPPSNKTLWIPFFRKTFYCHKPVKVHCHLSSNVSQCTYEIYDSDGKLLSEQYNRHITYFIDPNSYGYDIDGYALLRELPKDNLETTWNLTVLCSSSNAFHVCDNNDPCTLLPVISSTVFQSQDIYVPNRRNILGSIDVDVFEEQTIGFRAAVNNPDLKLRATLKTESDTGEIIEVGECTGRGGLCWPFIRLEAKPSPSPSTVVIDVKPSKKSAGDSKIVAAPVPTPKVYTIEVTTPKGWPITLEQWVKAIEKLNSIDLSSNFENVKETKDKVKEKSGSKSAKKENSKVPVIQQPQEFNPEDAVVKLECAYNANCGVNIRVNYDGQKALADAIKSWWGKDPNRGATCTSLREQIRQEHILVGAKADSGVDTDTEDGLLEEEFIHRPELMESPEVEAEHASEIVEAKYLTLPPQLMEKFAPLSFVPLCMQEKLDDENIIIITPEMAEEMKAKEIEIMEAEQNRMKELDLYNDIHIMEWQKTRGRRIGRLFVDGTWKPPLDYCLVERDLAIQQEIQERQARLKIESKKETSSKRDNASKKDTGKKKK